MTTKKMQNLAIVAMLAMSVSVPLASAAETTEVKPATKQTAATKVSRGVKGVFSRIFGLPAKVIRSIGEDNGDYVGDGTSEFPIGG